MQEYYRVEKKIPDKQYIQGKQNGCSAVEFIE